jgi:ketosteroid isomerase-like protein
MSEESARILQVCEAYKRAVYDRNVEAFLGLYHAEARVFDTWGVWSYEGLEDRRKVIEDWFGSLGDERVSVTFDRIRTEVGNGQAALSARVVYIGLSAAGDELRSMQNRLTWVLRLGGGGWRILHEHTSVPIAFDGLKGLLQREP